MERKSSRIVSLVTAGLLCFSAGAASGITWMMFAGYKTSQPESAPTKSGSMTIPISITMPQTQLTRMGQLASLVEKLDLLLDNQLKLELDDRQRALILAQLEDLELNTALSEEDANIRVRTILAIIENDRETLVATGFRWPRNNDEIEPPSAAPIFGPRSIEKVRSLRNKLAGKKEG